jgi:hypothetical protein
MGSASSRHQCLIYEGAPSRHLFPVASALAEKLKLHHRCLCLNSRPMIAGMKSQLAALGVDVEHEIASGSLILSSEQNHLVGEWQFDVQAMIATLEQRLNQALRDGYRGLWATGDMTWEFGPARDVSKLLEYEWRLEEFIREHSEMGGICQYHADTLPREILRKGVLSHSDLFVNETLCVINPHFLRRKSYLEGATPGPEIDHFIDQLLDQPPAN